MGLALDLMSVSSPILSGQSRPALCENGRGRGDCNGDRMSAGGQSLQGDCGPANPGVRFAQKTDLISNDYSGSCSSAS
jgi:hypothetical protein